MTNLQSLRKQIDRLDRQLLRLLNRRAARALAVGQLKRRRRLAVYDGRREAAVLRQAQRANRGPLSNASVAKLFREILRQSRRVETSAKHRR